MIVLRSHVRVGLPGVTNKSLVALQKAPSRRTLNPTIFPTASQRSDATLSALINNDNPPTQSTSIRKHTNYCIGYLASFLMKFQRSLTLILRIFFGAALLQCYNLDLLMDDLVSIEGLG